MASVRLRISEKRCRLRISVAAFGFLVIMAGAGACAAPPTTTPSDTPSVPEGGGVSSASPTPTVSTAVAPAVGTVVVSFPATGAPATIANPNGDGFSVLQSLTGPGGVEQSVVRVYDVAGGALGTVPAGSFTGRCGATDITNGRGRLIVTQTIVDTPAAGLKPATRSVDLTAWRADTGSQLWRVTVAEPRTAETWQQFSCGGFGATLDGRWGVFSPSGIADYGISRVVNLENGELHDRRSASGTIGNWVIAGADDPWDTPQMVVDPRTWQAQGPFSGTVGYTNNRQWMATGLFSSYWSRGSPGVSPDGTLFYSGASAYSLPDMRRLWTVPSRSGFKDLIIAANATVAIVLREPNDFGKEHGYVMAFDVSTGSQLWSLDLPIVMRSFDPRPQVCGLTARQLLLVANLQLVTIDLATGAQHSYRDNTDGEEPEDCPPAVEGLYGLFAVGGKSVVQLLVP